MPRTGTWSLHAAHSVLGYNSVHSQYNKLALIGDWSFLNKHDAFFNMFEWTFPAIYKMFPDATYIYTRRDVESWLISIEERLRIIQEEKEINNRYTMNVVHSSVLHTSNYDLDIFKLTYTAHEKAVLGFFHKKPNFLIMNICRGDGWGKLAGFYGCNIPDSIFPHRNVSGNAHPSTEKYDVVRSNS